MFYGFSHADTIVQLLVVGLRDRRLILSIGAALVNNENVIGTQFHQTDSTVLDAASHNLMASL